MVAIRYKDCLGLVQAGGGGELSPTEVQQIMAETEKHAASLRRQRIPISNERMKEFAAEQLKVRRAKNADVKRVAVINAQKIGRRYQQAVELIKAGLHPLTALKAMANGRNNAAMGVRESADAAGQGYIRLYYGKLYGQLAKDGKTHLMNDPSPGLFGGWSEQYMAFNERVEAELEALGTGKLVTNDPDAQYLAKTLAQVAEEARNDLNRNGASIGKLDGWAPHSHNQYDLLSVKEDDWVNAHYDQLDHARTFPDLDPEEAHGLLRDIYQQIAYGFDQSLSRKVEAKPRFKGTSNIASSLGRHRELHYVPGGYAKATKLLGIYKPVTVRMMEHIRHAGRMAGVTELWGPNPEYTAASVVNRLKEQITRNINNGTIDRVKGAELNAAISGFVESPTMKVMTGEAGVAHSLRLAHLGQGVRNAEVVKTLGAVLLSSLPTEPITLMNNLHYEGMPWVKAFGRVTHGYLKGFESRLKTRFGGDIGRAAKEQRAVAYAMGEGLQAQVDNLVGRDMALDGPVGWLHKSAHLFYRLTGAPLVFDVGRESGARIQSAYLGHYSDTAWAGLPAELQDVMLKNNITEQHWDLWRQLADHVEGSEGKYLLPGHLDALTAEDLMPWAKDRLDAMGQDFSKRIARRIVADQREAEWVIKRIDKYQAKLDRANALYATARERLDADSEGAAHGLGYQLKDLQAQLANVRQQFKQGMATPYRAGFNAAKIKASMAKLEAKIKDIRKAAVKKQDAAHDAFIDRWQARQDELEAFITQIADRTTKRLDDTTDDIVKHRSAITKVLDGARREQMAAMARFYVDEANKAIPHTTDRARVITTAGLNPGTPMGEMVRMVTQLKTFSVLFGQEILGRTIPGRRITNVGKAKEWSHFGGAMAALTLSGLASVWLKDLNRGYTPRGLLALEDLVTGEGADYQQLAKLLGNAFVQGGGAGIYGDFMFANANRFNKGALETLGGPAPGDLWTLLSSVLGLQPMVTGDKPTGPWKQAAMTALAFAGGPLNIAGVKPIADALFMNALRESIDPNGQQRLKQTFKENYGSTPIW